jgi:transmembrane sensor
MTVPETPLPTPDRSQLQQEAATWFSRMRGPNADTYKQEFDAWLASSAQHLGAYNRAAEVWSLGKFLAEPGERDEGMKASGAPIRNRRPILIALSACAACVLLLGGWLTLSKVGYLLHDKGPEIADQRRSDLEPSFELATRPGESRIVRLSDGSSVALNPGTRLAIRFDKNTRHLRLQSGAARFEVAHERRSFVVAAGSGTVTARGTIFDVAIASDHRVTVKLLRGSVDVAMPTVSRSPARPARMIARLVPGNQIDFAYSRTLSQPVAPQLGGQFETIDLDHVRLTDLLTTANRSAPVQIGLGDPSLADLEVSGTLRVDDPDRLATQLGALLTLTIDRQSPSRIVLRPR